MVKCGQKCGGKGKKIRNMSKNKETIGEKWFKKEKIQKK